ncbi:MAG TPA: hypothetical protein VFV37_04195, partial [Luteibaculaceae bacterium]|nr:hypothetical protein [Luteibaculaceae bacterium]
DVVFSVLSEIRRTAEEQIGFIPEPSNPACQFPSGQSTDYMQGVDGIETRYNLCHTAKFIGSANSIITKYFKDEPPIPSFYWAEIYSNPTTAEHYQHGALFSLGRASDAPFKANGQMQNSRWNEYIGRFSGFVNYNTPRSQTGYVWIGVAVRTGNPWYSSQTGKHFPTIRFFLVRENQILYGRR